MRSAWEETLQRLAVGEPVYSRDEVWRWSPEEFESLLGLGLVREAEQATRVVCDACCEWHWEEIQWATGGRRAFIPCPEEGAVTVELERMRQWRIDTGRLAELLAGTLELTGPIQAIELGRVWHLGRRRLGGRFRDIFLATSETKTLDGALHAIQRYGGLTSGAVLLPRAEGGGADAPAQLRLVDLRAMTGVAGGRMSVDLEYLEDLFADGTESASSRVRSIPVPPGTSWDEVTLLVFDVHLQVTVSGLKTERSFEEAGFSDPDQRLQMLKLLAGARGMLDAQRAAAVFKDKTPLKKRMSRLRQILQELIAVDGDPIEHNKKAELYTCRFQIRVGSGGGFPTPDGASWMHFRFLERKDGRLVVSVAEKRAFRAQAGDRTAGRMVEEVAQRDEVISRVYSFEELELRAPKGKLTPEGEAFTALLRGAGKLPRKPDDMAVLKLAQRLREWAALDGAPLHFSEVSRSWTARFECSSEFKAVKTK